MPIANLLPFALWAALWLGTSPGSFNNVLSPGSPTHFLQGLSAVLPFAAAFAAGVIIIFKQSQRLPSGFQLFSPLTLAAIYGVVGLIAAFNSPSGAVALRWAALYLTVPLVLWAIVWGADPLGRASRIVSSTWLLIVLASTALFVTALIYLELTDMFLDPARFLECRGGAWLNNSNWIDLTSGQLRDTGVGRYAAIAAIIAISGLWQARWRPVWLLVFLSSFILLLFTGARGSFAGFAAGAALTVLLYAGRRALLVGALLLAVLIPIFWATGAHSTFVDKCVVGGYQGGSPVSATQAPSVGQQPAPDAPSQQQADLSVSAREQAAVGTPAALSSEEGPGSLRRFVKFTGRTAVWAEGLKLLRDSPFLGFGFHADRLILGTHMHNAFLHALFQTGIVGTIPFMGALIFGWLLLFKAARKLAQFPLTHKHLIIQSGGILAFLTMRAVPESTGAFFGIDWLILAPLLLYLHLVNSSLRSMGSTAR